LPYVALHLELPVLAPQPGELLALGRAQSLFAPGGLGAVGSRPAHPVGDALRAYVKFARQLRGTATGLHQFDHLPAEFRRVRRFGFSHLGLLSELQ